MMNAASSATNHDNIELDYAFRDLKRPTKCDFFDYGCTFEVEFVFFMY